MEFKIGDVIRYMDTTKLETDPEADPEIKSFTVLFAVNDTGRILCLSPDPDDYEYNVPVYQALYVRFNDGVECIAVCTESEIVAIESDVLRRTIDFSDIQA